MDVRVNAEVECSDGRCGRTIRVVVDPAIRKVTHLVVKMHEFLGPEYLVPIELVAEATPELVRLKCAKEEVEKQQPFTEASLIPGPMPFYPYGPGEYLVWRDAFPEPGFVFAETERVPPGELAMRRGARVMAIDGDIGKVDEFLIDPVTDKIAHLVLQEGHLWSQQDLTIPVSEIDHIEEDTVYLKLDKYAVGMLPTLPVKKHS